MIIWHIQNITNCDRLKGAIRSDLQDFGLMKNPKFVALVITFVMLYITAQNQFKGKHEMELTLPKD